MTYFKRSIAPELVLQSPLFKQNKKRHSNDMSFRLYFKNNCSGNTLRSLQKERASLSRRQRLSAVPCFLLGTLFCSILGCPSGRPNEEPDIVIAVDAGPTEIEIPERALHAMTYNVERLFDPVCDTGNCSPGSYEALPD